MKERKKPKTKKVPKHALTSKNAGHAKNSSRIDFSKTIHPELISQGLLDFPKKS